jgi:Bestrophin, RFP-TM, chloride channel
MSASNNKQPQASTTAPAIAESSAVNQEDEAHWEKIQRIEKKRLEIIDWVEQPFWQTLFHWNGTVLKFLASDSLLWITMGIYIVLRIISRLNLLPDYLADVSKGNIAVVGTFLTFFLVFYVNQSHKRFTDLYGESMKCKVSQSVCLIYLISSMVVGDSSRAILAAA